MFWSPSTYRCTLIAAWFLSLTTGLVSYAQDESTTAPSSVESSQEVNAVDDSNNSSEPTARTNADGTRATDPQQKSATSTGAFTPIELIPTLPPDVPASFISFLKVDGQVIEDRAELQVDVRVSLTRPGLWEEVPLRLAESRVVSVKYEGDGQHGPVVAPDRGEGLLWKFRGQGDHLLRLTVEVPIKRSALGSTFALSLPRLHKSFSSVAMIKIPGPSLDIDAPALDATTVISGDSTVVTARMRGGTEAAVRSLLELRWRPTSTVAPGSILSVDSEIAFRVDPDRRVTQLSVDQTIVAVDQSLTSIRMRVPTLFDLSKDSLSIRGDRYVEHRVSGNSDGTTLLTVSLTEAASNELRLRWDFERSLGDGDEELLIDGLDILNADSQRGRFVCLATPGYRTSIDWDDSEGIRQVAADNANEVAAASVRRFPFTAVVKVRRERPSITVAPTTSIIATEAATKLRSTFRIDVDRGLVDELTGEWASPEAAVWNDLQLLAPADATLSTSAEGFVIQLRSPRDAGFTVTLAGTADGVRTTDLIGVPRILAQNEAPTTLRVYASDSVSLELDSASETVLSPLETPVLEPPPVEADGCRLVEQVRVVGEPASIRLNATVREAVATATTAFEVRTNRPNPNANHFIEHTQQIDVGVKYGRISELRLKLPIEASSRTELEALASEYRFRVNGRPIFNDQVSLDVENHLLITLKEAVNRCTLTVETVSASIPQEATSVAIPILQLVDVPFDSLTCRVARNQLLATHPSDGEGLVWTESPISAVGSKAWIAVSPPADVDRIGFRLTAQIKASEAALGIASLQSRISVTDVGHLVEMRARFRQTNGAVIVALPLGARSRSFTWNGERVVETVAVDSESTVMTYQTFEIPTAGSEQGTLRITYRVEDMAPSWLSAHTVALPAFPSDQVWREQDVQVAIDLPQERFLLRSPSNLTPRYVWQRSGLFWQRISPAGFEQQSVTEPVRHYLFSSPAVPEVIKFRTLRGTALIFVAGMASLAFAFVLYRKPTARTVPRLLAMAVGLVACGLFDPEVLRLLMQPVLLGTCFALIAVAIDHLRTRTVYKAPLLTVVSENEYSNWSESELRTPGTEDFATSPATPGSSLAKS